MRDDVDALVLAGGRPDPGLAGQALPKAFASLGGRTMVEWVLAALRAVPRIGRIALVGPHPLPPAVAAQVDLPVPAQGGLLENAAAGLAALAAVGPVLVAAADIPLLTPRAVEAFLDAAAAIDADVWYPAVPRADVERAFPGAAKTFVRFRDGTFTGGSLILTRPEAFQRARPVIERAVHARKRPWELARLLGVATLAGLATGRLRIADAEHRAARVAGIRARAVVCRYPEIAIDVDRPETLALIRRALEARQTSASVPGASSRVRW